MPRPHLLVSVHDIAPASAGPSERWLADLDARGIPGTLLVIPGPWRGVRLSQNLDLVDVYGTGSQRDHLERLAAELPITFHGYLADRAELAARIAEADVVIAPGPAETFGLTVLESLACGTPVVTADTGGAGELLAAGAGIAAASTGADMARAVAGILAWPEAERGRRHDIGPSRSRGRRPSPRC